MRIGTHQNEKKSGYAAGHSKDVLTSLNNQVSTFIDELTKLLPTLDGGEGVWGNTQVQSKSNRAEDEINPRSLEQEGASLNSFASNIHREARLETRRNEEGDTSALRTSENRIKLNDKKVEKDGAAEDGALKQGDPHEAQQIAQEAHTLAKSGEAKVSAKESSHLQSEKSKGAEQKAGAEIIGDDTSANGEKGSAGTQSNCTDKNGDKAAAAETLKLAQTQATASAAAVGAGASSLHAGAGTGSIAAGELSAEAMKKIVDAAGGVGSKVADIKSMLMNDNSALTKALEVSNNKLSINTPERREEMRTRAASRVSLVHSLERVENALKEVAKSHDGKTISLRLDPPDLGTVKIDVSLRDNSLHARMVAENSSVAQALKERASELQVVLRKIGLDVDTVSVAVAHDDGLNFDSRNALNSGGNQKQGGSSLSDPSNAAQAASPTVVAGSAHEAVLDHWVA